MSRYYSYTREIAICAFFLFLLCIFASSVTGLHHDEAWIILQAKKIANGLRPLSGMTFYTGALHQYLLWPLFEVFGYTVEVLRVSSAVFNTLALFFALLIVRELHPHKRYQIEVGLLLCTFPAFITFSRFSIEVTALNPLLLFAGLFFIIKSTQSRAFLQVLLAIIGGFCFGLAAYNHLVGIVFPLALGLSALLFYRKACWSNRAAWLAFISFFISFSPRLIRIIYHLSGPGESDKTSFRELIKDYLNLPQVLAGIWDGNLIYNQYVGQNFLWVAPYTTLAMMALLVGCIICKRTKLTRFDRAVIAFLCFSLFLTLIITPGLSLRYFEMSVLFIPYLIIRLVATLREQRSQWNRKFAHSILMGLLVLNCCYLTVNYYFNFVRTSGTISIFPVGHRLIETSSHFVQVDKLYHQLVERGVQVVIGQDFIVVPLKVYDIEKQALQVKSLDPDKPLPRNRLGIDKKTSLIYYNGVTVAPKWDKLLDFRDRQTIKSGEVEYRLDPSFDSHFLVFHAVS